MPNMFGAMASGIKKGLQAPGKALMKAPGMNTLAKPMNALPGMGGVNKAMGMQTKGIGPSQQLMAQPQSTPLQASQPDRLMGQSSTPQLPMNPPTQMSPMPEMPQGPMGPSGGNISEVQDAPNMGQMFGGGGAGGNIFSGAQDMMQPDMGQNQVQPQNPMMGQGGSFGMSRPPMNPKMAMGMVRGRKPQRGLGPQMM